MHELSHYIIGVNVQIVYFPMFFLVLMMVDIHNSPSINIGIVSHLGLYVLYVYLLLKGTLW